jgi:hypothetical protein
MATMSHATPPLPTEIRAFFHNLTVLLLTTLTTNRREEYGTTEDH